MFKNGLIRKEPGEKLNNKKNIENLSFLAVLLIIIIVSINFIWKPRKNTKNEIQNVNKILANNNIIENNMTNNYENNLEQKLKNILSNIEGVGNVDVLITYSQTSSINPIYNEDYGENVTEEEDVNGGKRKISSSTNKKEVVSSNNNIITQSVSSPEILGAVVIASGANNSEVKNNIIQVVEAATGLASHKIQVFQRCFKIINYHIEVSFRHL